MEYLQELISYINSLNSIHEKIDAINEVRLALHDISPFFDEPVDCVLWVKSEGVEANDYNPNSVAPPEMKLLEISILEDGYTQPIVAWGENGYYEVVDGFHRNRVGKECIEVSRKLNGYLPIVNIKDSRTDKGDRMASTIRHNRARGKHQVDAMSDIVRDLVKRNWSDTKIAKELGMEADEVLRLKQISGLSELFSNIGFSEAWE
jgi:Predicted transcriptional regulators